MRRRHALGLIALALLLPGPLAAEEKKKAGGESYLQIGTMTATTNRGGGRRGVLTVDCGLDIPNAKLRERANLSLPRLRAAFVQTVQTYASGLSPGTTPDPDYLGQSLQRQTDTLLGQRGARLLMGAVLVN